MIYCYKRKNMIVFFSTLVFRNHYGSLVMQHDM